MRASGSCCVMGDCVPLPAKTLSTLLVLVRKNGHLVEKDVLMKEVWPDEYVEEGNLAQHIYILRRALGESTESPGISRPFHVVAIVL